VRRLHLLAIALAVAAADLATKAVVLSRLALHEEISAIPGFLNFVHVQNRGAAFGVGSGSTSTLFPLLLTAGAVAVFIAVVVFSLRTPLAESRLQVALHLVAGGAIGNLTDRFRLGYVVDFLDAFVVVNGRSWHWPAFNLADAAICCGIVLMLMPGDAEEPAEAEVRQEA
jgi:signal peptidase II